MKKRLLFIPLHWDASPRPHEDYYNALCNEFDVTYHSTKTKAEKFDYILIHSGAMDEFALRCIVTATDNPKLIQWTGDCRPNQLLPEVMMYKDIADLTLLVVGIGQKEMYESALGSPVDYLQQGVFNSFFIEPKELQSGQTVFIGNNYDQFDGAVERARLCSELSDFPLQFEVIGNGFAAMQYNNTRSIPYDQSAPIYNEAYISISHACFNDVEGYYSNRTLDIMASGSCCLMRHTPNAERYFTNEENVMFYHNNDEAIEIIQFLKANPDVRNAIALSGYNLAKKYHTFDYRSKELKQLIQKYEL